VTGRLLLDPDTKATLMKTMTCRHLGGPCDFAHHGEDANEVIKAQDRHLREAVASGATDHEPALTAMKGRWKRPISGMRWYRQAQRDFAALPDEPEGE
jgi:predicted small metal-binding protein